MPLNGFVTTTAAGMGGLPERLQDSAGPAAVERAFARADLPIELLNDLSLRIPMTSMIALFGEAERFTDHPQFGLQIGLEMTGREIGAWFEYSSQASTLRLGLQRLGRAITLFQNGPSVTLIEMRSGGIMRYHVPRDKTVTYAAHSDHNVPLMLDFVQRYLGPDWRPRWIEIDYPDRGHGSGFADLVQSQPLYGRSALSLPLTTAELDTLRPRTLRSDQTLCWADVQAQTAAEANDFMIAVEACVLLDMLDGPPELDSVARRMNLSARSLQRRLMVRGHSFRDVLARVRYRRALSLLHETDLGVTEIAHRLGYSEVANFSRAFKSWAGCAPSNITR